MKVTDEFCQFQDRIYRSMRGTLAALSLMEAECGPAHAFVIPVSLIEIHLGPSLSRRQSMCVASAVVRVNDLRALIRELCRKWSPRKSIGDPASDWFVVDNKFVPHVVKVLWSYCV